METDMQMYVRRLETVYDFQCAGGALKNCEEWKMLKGLINRAAKPHSSDCSLHNGPAYKPEPCDCGADPAMTPEVYGSEFPNHPQG